MKGSSNPEVRRLTIELLADIGESVEDWVRRLRQNGMSNDEVMAYTTRCGFLDEEIQGALIAYVALNHDFAMLILRGNHMTKKDWVARMKYAKGVSNDQILETAEHTGFFVEDIQRYLVELDQQVKKEGGCHDGVQ